MTARAHAWQAWRRRVRRDTRLGSIFTSAGASGPGFPAVVAALNPRHWWRLNTTNLATEPDVGVDPDEPMTALSGSVTAHAVGPFQQGVNYAANFPGTTGNVSRPGGISALGSGLYPANDFNGTTSGSIAVLFKTSANPALDQFICGYHTNDSQFDLHLRGSATNAGCLDFTLLVQAIGSRHQITNAAWNDGNWHLAVVTCDGASPNLIYVDGLLRSTFYSIGGGGAAISTHAWVGALTSFDTAAHFQVGADEQFPATVFFNGSICDVMLFQGALTSQNVTDMWAAVRNVAGASATYGRNLSPAALAQLPQRHVEPIIFVSLGFDSGTLYLHNRIGLITWGGTVWQGLGDFGGVEAVEEGRDLSPYGVSLRLSSLDSVLAQEALRGNYALSEVVLYIGFLDPNTLQLVADPSLWWSGTADTMDVSAGEQSQIVLACESDLIKLDRANGALFSDTELKRLYPGDTFFDYQPLMQELLLRWSAFAVHHPATQMQLS